MANVPTLPNPSIATVAFSGAIFISSSVTSVLFATPNPRAAEFVREPAHRLAFSRRRLAVADFVGENVHFDFRRVHVGSGDVFRGNQVPDFAGECADEGFLVDLLGVVRVAVSDVDSAFRSAEREFREGVLPSHSSA